MRFEEILPALREGKKVRCKSFDENGEYWMAGYISLPGGEDNKILTLHRFDKDDNVIRIATSWGMPRWIIMHDDWELIE